MPEAELEAGGQGYPFTIFGSFDRDEERFCVAWRPLKDDRLWG